MDSVLRQEERIILRLTRVSRLVLLRHEGANTDKQKECCTQAREVCCSVTLQLHCDKALANTEALFAVLRQHVSQKRNGWKLRKKTYLVDRKYRRDPCSPRRVRITTTSTIGLIVRTPRYAVLHEQNVTCLPVSNCQYRQQQSTKNNIAHVQYNFFLTPASFAVLQKTACFRE